MKPVDAVELAALVSAYGPVLINSSRRIPREMLYRYWSASRARVNAWCADMKRRDSLDNSASGRFWPAMRPVVEEILLTEVLTRVWGAVLAGCDQRRREREAEPIAKSTLAAHLDARVRAMSRLLSGAGVSANDAQRISRIHKQTERWTDLLVGFVAGRHQVAAFSCRPNRMRQFADDFVENHHWRPGQTAWRLLGATLRRCFTRLPLEPNLAAARHSAAVAASVLDCFDPLVFDADLHFPFLWTHRLESAADSAQSMIEELTSLA